MKLHRVYLGSITYQAGAMRPFEIRRNYALVGIDLFLIANLTRSITSGTAGGPKDSAPAQLVRNLTIKANGSDTIKSIDMETLHRHNQIMYGVRPYIWANDWLGYANQANKILKVFARIPFAMPRIRKQVDTLLDTPALSSLDLQVTFGQGIDTMNPAWATNPGAAVTVNNAILHVAAVEYLGVPAKTNFLVYNQWVKQQQVTAATNRFQIKMPVGNVYRGLLIKTTSDGNLVDTIMPLDLTNMNEINLRSGTEVYVSMLAGMLQAQNRLTQGIEVPEVTSDAAALNHALLENVLTGYYYIDFCRDGLLSEALDTRALSDLEFMLQVAKPGTNDFVEVYADELLLPAVTVPAAAA